MPKGIPNTNKVLKLFQSRGKTVDDERMMLATLTAFGSYENIAAEMLRQYKEAEDGSIAKVTILKTWFDRIMEVGGKTERKDPTEGLTDTQMAALAAEAAKRTEADDGPPEESDEAI